MITTYHLSWSALREMRQHAKPDELAVLERLEDFTATGEDVEAAQRIAERAGLHELVAMLAAMGEASA